MSFGAKLTQLPFPKHGHESELTFMDKNDIIYKDTQQPFKVGRYHSWVVSPESLPPVLQVSSVDEDENIMSFYHRTLPIHGVQYHPESIITKQGRQLINNWLNE